MRDTYIDILNLISGYFGTTYTKVAVHDRNNMKALVSNILDDISIEGKIPFLKKYAIRNIVDDYATGTITIITSNNISTVTGVGTVFTADMKGRKLIITGESSGYKIKSVTSTLVLILEEIYINPSDYTSTQSTASSYGIYQEEVVLPYDFAALDDRDIYDFGSGIWLDLEDPLVFDKDFPENVQTGVSPIRAVLRGLTEGSFYSDGTIAITKDSNAVKGTDTTWTAFMTGKTFRIDGYREEYIFTYLSTTTGTLDRTYAGATITSGGTYKIDSPGLRILQIDPKVTRQTNVKIGYYKLMPRLVNDNDVPILPSANAIISGGIWKYAQYKEKKDYSLHNPLRLNYERDLATLRKLGRTHITNEGLRPRVPYR